MPSVIVNVVIAAFMPLNLSATTLRLKFVFVFFLAGKVVPLRWFQRELSRKKRPDDVKSRNSTLPPPPFYVETTYQHSVTIFWFDLIWFAMLRRQGRRKYRPAKCGRTTKDSKYAFVPLDNQSVGDQRLRHRRSADWSPAVVWRGLWLRHREW